MPTHLFTVYNFFWIWLFSMLHFGSWKAFHRSRRMGLISQVSCIHYAVCSPRNGTCNHK